jgi:prepilin-type N-terminal cleavage/methylation domain-containing protein
MYSQSNQPSAVARPTPIGDFGRATRGFTLVELLIVLTILTIIATMILFALAGAQEQAKAEKTRSMVGKLDALLMTRWSKYESRRVPMDMSQQQAKGKQLLRKRLDGLRELMALEFPDSWADVKQPPRILPIRPAASVAYERRYRDTRDPTGKPARESRNADEYAGAECLYMILTTSMAGEESARAHFKENEIRDVDQDGFFEFLDGWGNPIMFLRWAPGHISPIQTQEKRNNPKKFHDAFDPHELDDKAFPLTPLIYSAGPDGQYDIARKQGGGNNNPYANMDVGQPRDTKNFDSPQDGQINAFDNITNHMLGLR